MGPRVRVFVAVAGSFLAVLASAQPIPRDLPPSMRTVSDEVGVLTADEGLNLSRALEGILDEDDIRVLLVIAKSVQPESIEDYTERLSRRWARDRQIDPRRTIFIILALNDREMVVMPGRTLGLESALARPEVSDGLVVLFRQGRYYEALMTLAERVHRVIHESGKATAPTR